MARSSSLDSALAWLRALGRNRYFWGGLGGLLLLGFGVYLVVDAVLMPAYTRHEAKIRVPDVEDRPFEEAKSLLTELDLQVERQVGRFNPNVDQNVVVDQTPLPSSTVKPGRRVYLTVNAGEVPTLEIPDFTGMSVREAKNRVSSLGFSVDAVQEDPVPSPYANTITKQRPPPGDSLQKGESVSLWYSTGLGDEEVGVPRVLGLPLETARDQLLNNDLRSVVVDTTVSDETDGPASERDSLFVNEQGHTPGTQVRAGTEIRLFTTTDASEAARLREASSDTTTADRPDASGGAE